MKSNILNEIASQFILSQNILSITPLGDGFINDTFFVRTKAGIPNYILQRKNKKIFSDIPALTDNIYRVTNHMRKRVIEIGGDPLREVMTIVPSHTGKYYHIDNEGEFWTVTVFIDNTITYNKADSPELAYKGGQGIGKFQALLSDFEEPLKETIPGFHNLRYRLEQWDNAVDKNASGRIKFLSEEMLWIESRRQEMIDFWEKVENGVIPMRVTHNDTKINNILFDMNGEVLCAIDLDTVMFSTSLNDFGDSIRSYTNTGEEDDKNLENIGMSLNMFASYTDGYLSQCANQLEKVEIDNLAFSARYITYEQVLRFLMDYIDGDKYYKIKYPEHNLVRTHAQYKLLKSMELQYDAMCEIVHDISLKYLKR